MASLTFTWPAGLLIIDTLHPIIHHSISNPQESLPSQLAPFLGPRTSLLAVLHMAVPLPPSPPYQPSPQTLLAHAATSIITLSQLSYAIAARRAESRALPPPPARGLDEGVSGVLVGKGAQVGGAVLEVEHRKKAGRPTVVRYVMEEKARKEKGVEWGLLEEHPAYLAAGGVTGESGSERGAQRDEDGWTSTFELGLTKKEGQDREGVVLPHFDAQRGYERGNAGEGGKILYQMGSEDLGDWDDEEDEI